MNAWSQSSAKVGQNCWLLFRSSAFELRLQSYYITLIILKSLKLFAPSLWTLPTGMISPPRSQTMGTSVSDFETLLVVSGLV